MLLFIMLLTNQSIYLVVEDREKRTMLRMFTAPVRAGEIAAGNFLASIMLGTLQLVLIVIVMYNLIGYDMGISAGRLLLVMECFLLSSVGIATSVASMVKSVKNLGYINNLVVTPTCILGGCFWPIGLMPDFMQKLSSFTPQRWRFWHLRKAPAAQPGGYCPASWHHAVNSSCAAGLWRCRSTAYTRGCALDRRHAPDIRF